MELPQILYFCLFYMLPKMQSNMTQLLDFHCCSHDLDHPDQLLQTIQDELCKLCFSVTAKRTLFQYLEKLYLTVMYLNNCQTLN